MVNHHFIGNGLSLICIIYIYVYIYISVSSGLMKSDHLKRNHDGKIRLKDVSIPRSKGVTTISTFFSLYTIHGMDSF